MDVLSIVNAGLSELTSSSSAAFALAAIGLGIHFGYSGLLNFGQAGFMAIGAYGFAMWTSLVDPTELWGWPPLLSFVSAVLVAVLASVIFALILGIPTLRLRGDYLAIVTIAAAEIIRFTVRTGDLSEVTGGSQGMNQQEFNGDFVEIRAFDEGRIGFGPFEAGANEASVRVLGWSLVVIALLVTYLLMRSPWGRVVKGIREDEDAVRSLGKNVYSYKMQALVLGGVMGTLGGIIFTLPRAIQPDNYSTPQTFYIWTALLLGGAATTFGPVLGSVLFWMLLSSSDALLRGLSNIGALGDVTGTQAGQLRFVLMGLALMALVIFRPQGIMGKKKDLSLDV